MKIKCLIPKRHIIAALLLLINVLGIPSLRAHAIPLGKLDGWWRYTTLQGTLLKSAAQFQTVPAYLTDPALSFPYQRRVNPSTGEPYAKEMLFADGLYLVRLIGGWDPDAGGEASDYRGDISLADVWYRTPANGLGSRNTAIGYERSGCKGKRRAGASATILDSASFALCTATLK